MMQNDQLSKPPGRDTHSEVGESSFVRRSSVLIFFAGSLTTLLTGFVVLSVKDSIDRSAGRAVGESLADTASSTLETVSNWDGKDWQRAYRAAGAIMDLMMPVEESETAELRMAVNTVMASAKKKLRQEDVLKELITVSMRDDLLERLENPIDNSDLLVDLATSEVLLSLEREGISDEENHIRAERARKAVTRAVSSAPSSWRPRFLAAALNYVNSYGEADHERAIDEFRSLLEAQESKPQLPAYAWTYLFLGNLQLEAGSRQEAQKTWLKGLELFPENELLLERVAAAESRRGRRE